MTNPHDIVAYAHAHLVEQVMALHGRASDDPRTYRRVLERMSNETLRRTIEESNFPAPELTTACEEPRRIQADETGSVRGVFNPQIAPISAEPNLRESVKSADSSFP